MTKTPHLNKYLPVILILLLTVLFLKNYSKNRNLSKLLTPEKNEEVPGDIDVDEMLLATNSATVELFAGVVNFDRIEFYLNDKKVKEIRNNSGSFTELISGLIPGSNDIYLVGINSKTGQKKKGEDYKVFYKNTKPKLEILQPANNMVFKNETIEIRGITEPETFVLINDNPVKADAQFNFKSELTLTPGENIIEIYARDFAGNVNTKKLTVIYD